VMIELIVDRLEDLLDLGEVANPSGMRVDLSLDVNADLERMAVETPALVTLGYVRQAMGGLEDEFLEQFHARFLLAGAERDGSLPASAAGLSRGRAAAAAGDRRRSASRPVRGTRHPVDGFRPSPAASSAPDHRRRPDSA